MSVAMDAIETIMFIIMALTMIAITIWSSIPMVPKMIKKKVTASGVIIGSLLSLSFYFLTGLLYLMHVIFKLYGNQPDLADIMRSPAGACYMIGQWWMTFSFIKRLIFAFSGSTFKLSNCTKKSLYIPYYSSLIFAASGALIGRILNVSILYIIAGALWIIVHIILSITLIVLFIRKLRKLMVYTPSLVQSHSSSTLTARSLVNMDLLYVAIKNGLLVPIAIISSLLSMFFGLTFSLVPALYLLVPISIALDSTVSSICIFLLFAGSSDVYNILCKRCHSICEKWQSNSLETEKNQPQVNSSKIDVTSTDHSIPTQDPQTELGIETTNDVSSIENHESNTLSIPNPISNTRSNTSSNDKDSKDNQPDDYNSVP